MPRIGGLKQRLGYDYYGPMFQQSAEPVVACDCGARRPLIGPHTPECAIRRAAQGEGEHKA